MSNTDTETQATPGVIFPPPPRLVGDYAVDNLTLNDYNSDIWQGLTQSPPTSIDPNNLPDPATQATIATAQMVANLAYQAAVAINEALGKAGVSGFPITLPTS